jgi:hypothetical protein
MIFIYYCWPYEKDIYMLYLYYGEMRQRVCYKLHNLVLYILNFYLPLYEFWIGLYVNFEK